MSITGQDPVRLCYPKMAIFEPRQFICAVDSAGASMWVDQTGAIPVDGTEIKAREVAYAEKNDPDLDIPAELTGRVCPIRCSRNLPGST